MEVNQGHRMEPRQTLPCSFERYTRCIGTVERCSKIGLFGHDDYCALIAAIYRVLRDVSHQSLSRTQTVGSSSSFIYRKVRGGYSKPRLTWLSLVWLGVPWRSLWGFMTSNLLKHAMMCAFRQSYHVFICAVGMSDLVFAIEIDMVRRGSTLTSHADLRPKLANSGGRHCVPCHKS